MLNTVFGDLNLNLFCSCLIDKDPPERFDSANMRSFLFVFSRRDIDYYLDDLTAPKRAPPVFPSIECSQASAIVEIIVATHGLSPARWAASPKKVRMARRAAKPRPRIIPIVAGEIVGMFLY